VLTLLSVQGTLFTENKEKNRQKYRGSNSAAEFGNRRGTAQAGVRNEAADQQ
jgi:hypothetical protein